MIPRSGPGGTLRAAVLAVVMLGLVAPIAAGLLLTAQAGFGWLPALGATEPGLDPWRALWRLPGLGSALRLTLVTGLGASLLSLLVTLGVLSLLAGRLPPRLGARVLAPFLAMPHAALAIGLAFLLAPSGWIARLLAPLAGWTTPPDIASVGDPWGLALILGLMVKEVPFLLLVSLSALSQIPVRAQLAAARSLGYGAQRAWVGVILPQLWPLIRRPLLVVLAFSLSVVDMALILGPSNPPTLAVMLTRLFTNPDTRLFLPAAAGALLQAGLVAGAFAGLLLVEALVRNVGCIWLRRGGRGRARALFSRAAGVSAVVLLGLGALAMAALVTWSLAWTWRFPQILPADWSLRAWSTPSGGWGRALGQTLILAGATTVLALTLAVAWLEAEDRSGRRAPWAEALVLLPLLVPQIAFLFGLNVLFLRLGLQGGLPGVIWAQTLFVFPYALMALADPWRALDPRLGRVAASLGAGSWRRLVRVKLPVLLAPLSTAAAIGVAVSVAQYLPTLFMGAGRVSTLTTEAVTLSAASDRRVVAVYATLQAMVPFAAYALAFALPALIHRNRRALIHGGA